ncbi:hypothetical protein X801_02008 [Opisthorchis viverrini]|uniref:Uncharacterized protein n=1 Tax=Opisthorchis viverrini TaxID=6198 RepID=A0A1S8X5W1_OPIVI|nr:hypothetical protein X801_02008 [Opisthorchis viverrini]
MDLFTVNFIIRPYFGVVLRCSEALVRAVFPVRIP